MILNERTKERFKRSTFFEKFLEQTKKWWNFLFYRSWLEEVKAKTVERKNIQKIV